MENSEYFKINNVDALPPFFMNIVSGSDLWTFASSNGGITAGRRSAEFALFPYYTDDKITDLAETTGSKTIIRKGGACWEPFSVRSEACFRLERNLYKSRVETASSLRRAISTGASVSAGAGPAVTVSALCVRRGSKIFRATPS